MFDVNNAPKSRLLFLLGISEVHQPKFLSKLLASLLGVESHSKSQRRLTWMGLNLVLPNGLLANWNFCLFIWLLTVIIGLGRDYVSKVLCKKSLFTVLQPPPLYLVENKKTFHAFTVLGLLWWDFTLEWNNFWRPILLIQLSFHEILLPFSYKRGLKRLKSCLSKFAHSSFHW